MTREQSRVVSVSGGTLVGGENLVAYWRSFFVSFSRFISFSFACPCPPLLTYMGPFPLVHGASSHSFSPCLSARRFLHGKSGRGASCSMEAAAAARNSVCVISGRASSPRGSWSASSPEETTRCMAPFVTPVRFSFLEMIPCKFLRPC